MNTRKSKICQNFWNKMSVTHLKVKKTLAKVKKIDYSLCGGVSWLFASVKKIHFLRFAAKQVRASSDDGATVGLVPRGETPDVKEPVKAIIVEIFFKLKSFQQDGKTPPIERFNAFRRSKLERSKKS